MRMSLTALITLLTFTYSLAQFQLSDKGAVVSFKVMEMSTGETIGSHNEELRLTPASLTKVVTTATALELLSPDFTFKTGFYYLGKIKKGRLLGDLLILSNGDPALGSKYFDQNKPETIYGRLAEELRMAEIKFIEGSVLIVSDTISYSAPRLWEDMGNYYGASPQGFNWADNTTELTLRSSEAGSMAQVVSIEPNIAPYTIRCQAMAANHNNDSAYVYGVKDIKEWWIEGSIPQNRSKFKIRAALPDPAQTFKNGLEAFLKNEGITFGHNTPLPATTEKTTLFIHNSPPLSEIIRNINHLSNNLFADQLLLTLGKEFKGTSSWDKGNRVITEFWSGKIDFQDNIRLYDGSGLSPKNLISANGMVQLLTWMQQNSSNYEVFAQSLAKGGETGTLRTVFKNPEIKGKIIGKSGSMGGVLGYCGYLSTLAGKDAAFCVIANNYLVPAKQIRQQMDELLTNLILEK